MLVGDSGVGKTCLLVRFKDAAFLAGSFISTVGIDFRVSWFCVSFWLTSIPKNRLAGIKMVAAVTTVNTDLQVCAFALFIKLQEGTLGKKALFYCPQALLMWTY